MLFKPLTVFLHLLANPNQQKHAFIPQNYYFLVEFSTFYLFARMIVILKSKFQPMLFFKQTSFVHSSFVLCYVDWKKHRKHLSNKHHSKKSYSKYFEQNDAKLLTAVTLQTKNVWDSNVNKFPGLFFVVVDAVTITELCGYYCCFSRTQNIFDSSILLMKINSQVTCYPVSFVAVLLLSLLLF